MRSTKGSGTPQKRAAVIKASPATYTETFYALSAFLKVFLNLLDLDKPFTGGIGSFKLYVMVAYVLQRAPPTSLGEQPDLGFLLLAFFDFFGDPNNVSHFPLPVCITSCCYLCYSEYGRDMCR
jgi:DNA polymerase sigma